MAASIAAKLLLRPRDVEWEKNRDAVFHADYSQFTEVDGARVHYQEAGDPDHPPMILIHGFASSNLVWSKVFLEFAAAGFRVIAPISSSRAIRRNRDSLSTPSRGSRDDYRLLRK